MYLTNLLIKKENKQLLLAKVKLKATKAAIKNEKESLINDASYYASTPKGLLVSFTAGSFASITAEKQRHETKKAKGANNEKAQEKKHNLLHYIPWTTLATGLLRI